MIPFETALSMVMGNVKELPRENVVFSSALGRVLAEDVMSDMDMPPFDKSAMDGYACRRADIDGVLRVVESIPAGCVPSRRIGKGECSRIMTGAGVPEGADCVVMVEFTEAAGDGLIRFTGSGTMDNICRRAEDIRKGDTVLNRGDIITERHVAVLAAAGCVKPLCSRKARVGIIATGDELVEPAEKPGPAQIRNTNGWQLMAQTERMCAAPASYGIARDTDSGLKQVIADSAAENDVILLSGGVSAGDFDLVPGVLEAMGFELLFHSVAVKPGKPVVFGRSERCFCFGLPGNPVSTFVLFELLVKPFLYGLMGHQFKPVMHQMRLASRVKVKNTDRATWIPVTSVSKDTVKPVDYHGPAHISSLCAADGLICLPVGTAETGEGETVDVRRI